MTCRRRPPCLRRSVRAGTGACPYKEITMEFLRNVTIGQYVPGNSVIHRLDPRVKIILLLIFPVQVFLLRTERWWDSLLPAVFLAVVTILSGLNIRFVLRGLRSVMILVLITFFFNILFTEGTTLVSWSFIRITREGLSFGMIMSMRLIYVVLATSLLTLCTSPLQITDALESLMRWGRIFRLPVHEIAMMMSIALRFIPTLMEELERIIKAQMARGADFERGSLMKRVRSFVPVLVPLFVQAFRHADDLAVAMESRCYHGGEGRTRVRILRMGALDLLAVVLTGAFLIALTIVDTYPL